MTRMAPIPLPDEANWQVPAHETALFSARQSAFALVIPVINEGERIRAQLLRVQQADLPVDVVIADGGSSDGSLDPDFVTSAGVRCVLTKTGPGKLSAQLRMAYAWCLREGYEGIVTIDGNGKDGVEAVADMVARLEDGCDYVQGSRYLPGGKAENTPLERTIANRLIHAPLLSFAGRRFYTDTTNGFRAYSARYLTHPAVQPFRDEFKVYGLLFYLTVRAGQLGLKTAHVPVRRSYPETGTVPTKITGIGPKLALLGETVFAATGGHTPDEAAPRRAGFLWPVLGAAFIALVLLAALIADPPFSPDSWAFYELSKTVFGDFYRFSHFRSYASASLYSSAFPPLHPVLIALGDALFSTGARTGLFIALLGFAGFAVASEMIWRRATGTAWFGCVAAALLLLGPDMLLDEISAGRTIPVQLMLYALVLYSLLAGRSIGFGRSVAIGLVAGLCILNRFDAAALPVLVAAMIVWLTRKPLLGLASLAASALAVSPWVFYSWTTFGTLLSTDNSAIATGLDASAFVTDWWPEPQSTMADDPGAWAARVAGNALRLVTIAASLILTPMTLAFGIGAAMIAGLHWLAAQRPGGDGEPLHHRRALFVLALFAAAMLFMLAPQILTGYLEYRYFSAVFWAAFLAIGAWLVACGHSRHQRQSYSRLMALAAGVWLVPLLALQMLSAADTVNASRQAWSSFDDPADVRALGQCVGADSGARILVLGDDAFAARAGALGGFATMMEPRNMAQGRLGAKGAQAFADRWSVDYLLVMDPQRASFARATFSLERVSGCPLELYRRLS